MPANQVLKNFAMFVDGRGYAGDCEEVVLPKLTVKTEEFRAGGMDTPLDMDMGMEKLEMSFTMAGYNPELLTLFGLIGNGEVALTFRGALESYDNPVPSALIVAARGRFKEMDPGTHRAGDKPAIKYAASLSFYAMSVNGVPLVTIDTRNMIRMIGAVDQLAGVRAILGV